ncbi:MAG TPA: AraC family ligand binding domain-containing protein, partial [Mycobacteriales bacterium]|nr:AraC family ligand binding domain-containing protein [Mycobacteriales bacterium]
MTIPSDPRPGDLLVSAGRPSVAFYPPGTVHGPRELDRFEFAWVLQGSAEWWSGRLRHNLTPGSLLLVRPGMRDQFRWDARRPGRLGHVQFDLAGGGETAGWPVLRAAGPDDPLRGLTRYLLWLGSREPEGWSAAAERWSAATRGALGLLLTLFVAGPLPVGMPDTGLPPALEPV